MVAITISLLLEVAVVVRGLATAMTPRSVLLRAT